MSLGNCKFRQWDLTTYILEWLKFKTLTPNAGKDVEQKKFSLITCGIATMGQAILKYNRAVSYKTK